MIGKLSSVTDRIIWFAYLALVIITPLLFSTQNTELFEVPKMIFVYLIAGVLLTLTLFKFALEKKIILPKNAILTALLLFLAIQLAGTAGSIDKFTSIFGYPSRLNGGLLSQFAYFVIFVGALINLNRENIKKIILAAVFSASAVALWGIPAHFGADPNCFILTGNLNSTCWQAEFDPTKRIFSTLGQPNWLSSYLVLILPLAVSQIFTTKVRKSKILFAAASLLIFMAFIFTNSRAGLVGLAISAITFPILIGAKRIQKNFKMLSALVVTAVFSIAIFGSTLVARINEIASPQASPGTESSKIRLIVWQGAIETAKNKALLGTGPETFAYSYYRVRPLAHNATTEWNFFYNKAHNEFLNYAANVGILGLSSYLVFLSVALYSIWKIIRHPLSVIPAKAGIQKSKTWILDQVENDKTEETAIISKAIFSAITGYLATIFFGFSTVATQLMMFLMIAFALILGEQNKLKVVSLSFLKNKPLQIFSGATVGLIGLYLVIFVARLLASDILISRARAATLEPDTLLAFTNVLTISPAKNPFYLADTAVALATYGANSEDEKTRNSMIEQSKKLAREALAISPRNIIIARRIANAYILISGTDQSFYKETRKIGETVTSLAPTDPQSYLTLAKIQIATEENERAKYSLQKALELKPDYVEAIELLEQLENQTVDPFDSTQDQP